MQMAIDVAGFSAAEADQLRQAMGSKRSAQRMERLRARFYAGMSERGALGEVADRIWAQMAAFANFGFPESHSVSFAYLVYSSAWLKLHYPAAFLAGLLDNQPMGFWSPQTLVLDARRHGVEVRRPDINASGATSVLEKAGDVPENGDVTGNIRGGHRPTGPAVRLGISYVRTIGPELAERIAAGRPYDGMEDVVRRGRLERRAGRGAGYGRGFRVFRARQTSGLVGSGRHCSSGTGPRRCRQACSAGTRPGRQRSGRQRSGRQQSGRQQSGRQQSDRRWSGRRWSGRRWSGRRWSGRRALSGRPFGRARNRYASAPSPGHEPHRAQ